MAIILTSSEKQTLDALKQKVGKLTSEEALELAIQADDFLKTMGSSDPAYQHFFQQRAGFLLYAELVEKEEVEDKICA